MKNRTLKIDQEPAKCWYYVYDEEDDGRIVFGPTPDEKVAEAFTVGYNQASIDDVDEEDCIHDECLQCKEDARLERLDKRVEAKLDQWKADVEEAKNIEVMPRRPIVDFLPEE